jgi:mannosyltransferase
MTSGGPRPASGGPPARPTAIALLPGGVGFVAMLLVAGSSHTTVALDWDEGATLSVVTRSIDDMLLLARLIDAVLTPYYFVLHVVVKVLGESDVVLRLPSLLAMALGAGVVAELGRRVGGRATGIVAGVLCAAVPSLTFYANSARPYALSFLFATLSSLLLLVAVRTPTWWRWVGYAACLLLAGAFHLVSLAVLAGHVVIWAAAWLRDRDHRLWRGIPCALAALAILAPLMWAGYGQRSLQIHWVQRPTWTTIMAIPGDIVFNPHVGYLLLGLALAAFLALPTRRYLEFLALAVAPAVAIMAVSLAAPVWVPRYGLFLIAPLVVLAAATITAEPVRAAAVPPPVRTPVSRPVRMIALTSVLALLALPSFAAVRTHHNSPDTRAMAAVIHAHAEPGDVVVHTEGAWSTRPTLTHYMNELDWTRAPRPHDALLKVTAARNGTLDAVEFIDVAGRLKDVRRVWLVSLAVGSFGTPEDPLALPGEKYAVLRGRYTVQQTWTVTNARVVLLVAT